MYLCVIVQLVATVSQHMGECGQVNAGGSTSLCDFLIKEIFDMVAVLHVTVY